MESAGSLMPGVIAAVRRGDLRLLLSGPGSSGSRPMPDGRRQEPGGWNRIVLDVADLAAEIAAHRSSCTSLRSRAGQRLMASIAALPRAQKSTPPHAGTRHGPRRA